MKYLKDEINILQNTKNKNCLSEKEIVSISLILDQYNKIFNMALHQQEYINKKRLEYAREMEDNFRLTEKNKQLEEDVIKYKFLYKDQIKYIKELEKEIQQLKSLLAFEKKSNKKK